MVKLKRIMTVTQLFRLIGLQTSNTIKTGMASTSRGWGDDVLRVVPMLLIRHHISSLVNRFTLGGVYDT